MEKARRITGYFAGVEATQEHKGYTYSVGEALTIVILGSLCGLRNTSQIQQWAAHERVSVCFGQTFRNRTCSLLLLASLLVENDKG